MQWACVYEIRLFSSVKSLQKFKVCKSVHHHTFQINQPTRCNKFSSLLLDIYSYVQFNMFRASSRPLSGAQQLQQQPLVLPLERSGSSAVDRGWAGYDRQVRNLRICCICLVDLFETQILLFFRLLKPKRTESSDFHPRRLRVVAPALTPKYQNRTASKLTPS